MSSFKTLFSTFTNDSQENWIVKTTQTILQDQDSWYDSFESDQFQDVKFDELKKGTKLYIKYLQMIGAISHNSAPQLAILLRECHELLPDEPVANMTLKEIAWICISQNLATEK